jgi:hypothetical protein
MGQINRFIHAVLELIGLEIVEVLPPPDRSTQRNFEIFDRQAQYIRKLDREN